MKKFCIETPVLERGCNVYYQGVQNWICGWPLEHFFEINKAEKISLQITNYPQPQSVKGSLTQEWESIIWNKNKKIQPQYGRNLYSAFKEWLTKNLPEDALHPHKPLTVYLTIYTTCKGEK